MSVCQHDHNSDDRSHVPCIQTSLKVQTVRKHENFHLLLSAHLSWSVVQEPEV